MDPKKKFLLFKQGKHFCSVPWNHIEIFTNGSVKTCVRGQVFGNILDQSIKDILENNTYLTNLKQDLVNDQAHKNCTSCYNLSTNQEHTDIRNYYNSLFKSVNIDYQDPEKFELNGVDLHWDNTCNLKCIYCSPDQSSSIAQEQKIVFQKPKSQHLTEVVDLIVKNQWNLKEIYLSGGEPMLIKHNYELLKRLDNIDIPIRINSNITQIRDNNVFYNEIKRFRNVLWTVSVEATEDRFNYIRYGSQWSEFLQSMDQIKNLGHSLRVNSVWCLASIRTIFDTIRFFTTKYNITDFTINQLSGHPYLLVRNASDNLKQQARQDIANLLESDIVAGGSNTYYNIARCTKELDLPVEDATGYKLYLDRLDQLRGTNWRSVFKELNL